jgi:hypothetical protein
MIGDNEFVNTSWEWKDYSQYRTSNGFPQLMRAEINSTASATPQVRAHNHNRVKQKPKTTTLKSCSFLYSM